MATEDERVLISGDLFKQGTIVKTWRRRMCEVRGNAFVELSEREPRKEKSRIVLLPGTSVKFASKSGRPYCFSLAVPNLPHTLVFNADSSELVSAWISAIERASGSGEQPAPEPRSVGYDDFDMVAVLGKGTYGKVRLVKHRESGQLFAMKTMRKIQISRENAVASVIAERDILLQNRHPFLVCAHYTFQTESKIVLVMDYVPGGELFRRMRIEHRLSLSRTRLIAAEIALALGSMHGRRLIYRDLKPENVLFDELGHVKLTDFGYTKILPEGQDLTGTFCGTVDYLAPEILRSQPYGRSVDWWALGAVIYEMLTGSTPFPCGDNQRQMFRMILESEVRFPSGFDPRARDLVFRLMIKDPGQRLGSGRDDVEEIKRHPFFESLNWDDVLNRRVAPEWRPVIRSEEDISNFDREFTQEAPARSAEEAPAVPEHGLWDGFTAVNEEFIPATPV